MADAIQAGAATSVAVLGAGSWGTALAIQFARAGRPTLLWGRDTAQLTQMASDRDNRRYLPDASFPAALRIEPVLRNAIAAAQDILIAVPSHALRALLRDIAPAITHSQRLAWATKGFEPEGSHESAPASDVVAVGTRRNARESVRHGARRQGLGRLQVLLDR